MAPKKKQKTSDVGSEIPDWMKRALECPVCLETITDPPIFICENPQGHSLCSTCHDSVMKKDKKCPVCRKDLQHRRSMGMESMVENLPNKVLCKYDGCDFKRSDTGAVKKHEEECENRHVPCAYCDDKVGLKRLTDHLINQHQGGKQLLDSDEKFTVPFEVWINKKKDTIQMNFKVTNDLIGPQNFIINVCSFDEVTRIFWVAHIGSKDSALNYKYTLQIENYQEGQNAAKKGYEFECTRKCVPCDLSHEDVKTERCAIMLERSLIEKAIKEDYKFCFRLSISKV